MPPQMERPGDKNNDAPPRRLMSAADAHDAWDGAPYLAP